jgi:N-acetylmuramoyl-L-alanine amidase
VNIQNMAYPPPNFALVPRNLFQVTDLIVHHSAGALTEGPLDIDAQHRNQGWAMIGYNFVITPDGTAYYGRPVNFVPAAAYGRNAQSIDVCLIGNFQEGDAGFTGEPTAEQVATLKDLSVYLHQHFPSITVTIGHQDVATRYYPNDTAPYSTACPGNLLEAILPAVREYTHHSIAH